MREPPAYYAKKIKDLQENQKKIYEDWLNSQHQIFERYMKEFENMLASLQKQKSQPKKRVKQKKRKQPKRRKIRRPKAKRRTR
ncbi:MAG: hypothetical protein ACE5KA_02075 [Nitrososphaerales archaeon]